MLHQRSAKMFHRRRNVFGMVSIHANMHMRRHDRVRDAIGHSSASQRKRFVKRLGTVVNPWQVVAM